MSDDYDEFTAHHEALPPDGPSPWNGPKRLDVSDPWFSERMAELERVEGISATISDSYKRYSDAERVKLELSMLEVGNPLLSNFCAHHVYEWQKDKNPHHIDLVFFVCAEQGIEPTPTLIKIMCKVAKSRMFDSPAGTPDKLLRANIENQILRIMLNLVHAGDTLQNAASKAAEWAREQFPARKPLKASTISKYYEGAFRKPIDRTGKTQEEMYFANWDKWKTEEASQFWLRASETMPLADSELTGVRRR